MKMQKNYRNADSNISESQLKDLRALLSKQQKEKLSLSMLKVLQPYIRQYPLLLIVVVITSIISAGILLPVPLITKLIIDKYIGAGDVGMVVQMGIIIFCIYLVNIFIKISLNYSFTALNNKLLFSIKKDLTNRIIDFPVSFFSKNQSGYLLSRINEIDRIGSIFSVMFIQLVISVLTFIFSLLILGFLAWQILLLTVLFIPVHYFLVRKFSGGLQHISRSMMEKSANLNKELQEVISGIQTVKAFSGENKEKTKLTKSIQSYYKSSVTQSLFMGISQDLIGFIINISNLLVLTISALLIINNQFTVGLYVACIQYVADVFRPIQSFASAGVILQPAVVAIKRINEYFELLGEDSNGERTKAPSGFLGRIVFRDVCFSYEKNKHLLNKVTFKINEGDKVALIGVNGSGKTTIAKLLLQFHLPDAGEIFFDDINLKEIKLDVLRNRIGIVSQEVFLFNDTIKNNLLYGCSDSSGEKLDELTHKFCKFIYELPDGLDTLVGENGTLLSGGQKQAISIVRTLLKQSDILIWDEGSVHLDKDTKLLAQELVDEYFDNKTCLFIAHDGSFNKTVNRTLRIKNGTVIEVDV